ncbi:hypothetical protein QTJ16_001844 [Diplocarpon rosae]|uniref:Uncharacterized protein n=1 Tax=Diplocarpon rosae TaxID=946125 RepID=A0AAD9WGT1_9HELO|nr:hypothetical protein QTJ16_001844 [Diplocarpon rosae]
MRLSSPKSERICISYQIRRDGDMSYQDLTSGPLFQNIKHYPPHLPGFKNDNLPGNLGFTYGDTA